MSVSSVTLVRDVNNFMANSGPVTTGTTVLSLNYGTAPLLPAFGGTGTATHTGTGLPVFQTSPTIVTPKITTKANFTDGTSVENLQVTYNSSAAVDQLNFNSSSTLFLINASENQFNTNLTVNQASTPTINLTGGNFSVPGAISSGLSFAYKEDSAPMNFPYDGVPPGSNIPVTCFFLVFGNICTMRFNVSQMYIAYTPTEITLVGLPTAYTPAVTQVIPLPAVNFQSVTNPISMSISNTGYISFLDIHSSPIYYQTIINYLLQGQITVTYLLN